MRRLSPAEAAEGRPVSLRAVVTFYYPAWGLLFVQDDTGGIFVAVDRAAAAEPIRAGQRVYVRGVTQPGDFAPSVAQPAIVPLEMAELPEPRIATVPELATGTYDARWVEIRGVVRSVEDSGGVLALALRTEQGIITVRALNPGKLDGQRFVNAVVRVQGACGVIANDRRQLIGVQLWIPGPDHIAVLQASEEDPFSVAATPLGNLLRYAPDQQGEVRRVKVRGVVTLLQPGRGVFVQTGKDAVHVHTSRALDVEPGDEVE